MLFYLLMAVHAENCDHFRQSYKINLKKKESIHRRNFIFFSSSFQFSTISENWVYSNFYFITVIFEKNHSNISWTGTNKLENFKMKWPTLVGITSLIWLTIIWRRKFQKWKNFQNGSPKIRNVQNIYFQGRDLIDKSDIGDTLM